MAPCRFGVLCVFVQRLQKKGHVFAQYAHGIQSFRVAAHLTRHPAISHRPVAGPHHEHLLQQEETIHGVQRIDRTATPGRGDGGSHLVAEQAGVPVHIRHHRGPLQKRLHIGGDIRRIDRRTKEDAVRRLHLVKNFPEAVPAMDAVLLPAAGPAGLAGLDDLTGKLDHFRFDALFAQLIQYTAEQDICPGK